MFSWEDAHDRVAIVQMNAELRHAQLDLLAAQCATDRLRLRFSIENLARYGEKDVLRKTVSAAVALNEYYLSIHKQIPPDEVSLSASQVVGSVQQVTNYLWSQRQAYYSSGTPLSARQKKTLQPFFSPVLLDRIRTLELHGRRLPPPPFYSQACSLGIENLQELTHMGSLTFVDVIVFSDLIIERSLFHGLVHALQFQLLGLERYTDLFVRAFLRTKAHFSVPLESHAFSLESKFAVSPERPFSVEEQVKLWIREGRY